MTAPLAPRPDVLDFLLSRRSRPARTLTEPAPSRAELHVLLTAATRVPDHGKLEPWRFVVIAGAARARVAEAVRARGAALGLEAEAVEKGAAAFESPLCVAVVFSPKFSAKIPEHEQALSVGAVCVSLLNAAQAAGWGANWLSGFAATDRPFLDRALGLKDREWVAGFVHLGTETLAPAERPRPDVAALTSWLEP